MVFLIEIIVIIIPFWKICTRAGFHPAASLLSIIPLIGLPLMVGFLAFTAWPAARSSVYQREY